MIFEKGSDENIINHIHGRIENKIETSSAKS